MVRHECGFDAPIHCKRCGRPLVSNERLGLYCPHCGRRVSMICPGCGRLW
ncbi:DNA helicase PriA [Methanoculleus sp.]|nr:DNA helicase PriA [Methanoculleus sp.]MDI6866182.1 DNA helicase PriA [Methanoculleus sp.]